MEVFYHDIIYFMEYGIGYQRKKCKQRLKKYLKSYYPVEVHSFDHYNRPHSYMHNLRRYPCMNHH